MTDIASDLAQTARRSLQARKNEGENITQEVIAQALQLLAPAYATLSRNKVTPSDRDAANRLLLTIFVTEHGPALVLQNEENARPAPWYLGERRQLGPYMQRYLAKLEEGGWSEASISELRESTARIVESMENPERPGRWDWRGLVVGDVQSGKTASYAGVVNRAVDAGYRIIIILAGMHSILRLQTQKRFDQDFLGYDTNPKAREQNRPAPIIGVGEFNPNLTPDSLTSAFLKGDFGKAIEDQANFSPVDQPCILVVKKNASILKNLNNWIARRSALSRAAPALIIDDEADQASVDTGDQEILEAGTFKEDYDPKRVNARIRQLLLKFDRCIYVGYTATPFANIFIHDERHAVGRDENGEPANYGRDLFPATFLVQLTPPDDYFGPAAVFGTNDQDGLPLVRIIDQTGEDWIREKHDKTLKPLFNEEDVVPPSLREAIDAFLLTCATRAARGQGRQHNSMLVHVSRWVDVHAEVYRQVEKYLAETRAMISNGDAETLKRLKAQWDLDYLPTTATVEPTVYGRNTVHVTWEQIRACLADSSDKIEVMTANGKNKTDIDYDAYKETGRSLIAIGGDKLSRGLTLEGLSVSYFLRMSCQYDSLLQMGRWFGYRRGYADLCRMYTTMDMDGWFHDVANAQAELRAQFFQMSLERKTPKEFGLKVAVHDVLEITAKNKHRHTELRQSSYAGEGKIQSVMFRDRAKIEQNAQTTDDFIRGLGAGTENPTRPGGPDRQAMGVLWNGVSGRSVAEYLRSLRFPPESVEVNGSGLAAYINEQLVIHELTEWTVFLATGRKSELEIAGRMRRCVEREPRRTPDRQLLSTERFIIGTALSPLDQAIDLSEDEFATALNLTNQERQSRSKEPTKVPSGRFVRRVRGERPQNGLLIIYPMDPVIAEVEETDRPVIGVVVSFPDSTAADSRVYRVNSVLAREDA